MNRYAIIEASLEANPQGDMQVYKHIKILQAYKLVCKEISKSARRYAGLQALKQAKEQPIVFIRTSRQRGRTTSKGNHDGTIFFHTPCTNTSISP